MSAPSAGPGARPARGLLFSQMEPPPELEAEFHDWYDHDHIPARMRLPGFRSADRYRAVEGAPAYLACYSLDDMSVLSSPAYARLKADPGERTVRMLGAVSGFTRYICDEISDTGPAAAPGLLSVVAFAVPPQDVEQFESWYGEEHVPLLMEADGWLRVRRYSVRDGFEGPAWTHLALHEIAGVEAMRSPQREAARSTPRRAALAGAPWFARSGRWLYRPLRSVPAAPDPS